MSRLIFLGTGGGRFATITQARHTGGIRILTSQSNVQLDPGPGSIVYSNIQGLNPSKVTTLLVSHCHPDHYSDAEIYIEAMTRGMTRKLGNLIGPRSVLSGNDICGPCISKYHRGMVARTLELSPGDRVDCQDTSFVATRAEHSDPDTVGFRIKTRSQEIGYTSDTGYFDDIDLQYRGVGLLILCVLRPRGFPWKGHLSTDDAVRIIEATKPKSAIITDFGMRMIRANPPQEAKYIEESTGIPTVAAVDNMCIELDSRLPEPSLRHSSAE